MILFALLFVLFPAPGFSASPPNTPLRVGWIGALSGPVAKYGSHQAVQMAVEDINAAGGIGGRPLELIMEDGKCDGRTAVSAANKLIKVDKVKYILGGHCSPESIPIAPIAERNKVLMIAATTSSPRLTDAGDFIFRVTAVSLRVGELLSGYAFHQLGLESFGILYAETDYAEPVAHRFRDRIESFGGKVIGIESFETEETDFRPILLRFKAKNPAGLYIGVQAQDTADLILKQMHELNWKIPVFGNEVAGNGANKPNTDRTLYEGLTFAEPEYDLSQPKIREFIERFEKRYNVSGLPLGLLTAEAYDAAVILAQSIDACGDDPSKVKECLYQLKNYQGVSGKVSIDKNGDGLRTFQIKRYINGKSEVVPFQSSPF